MQKVEEAEKGLTRIYETLARVDAALGPFLLLLLVNLEPAELRTPNSELSVNSHVSAKRWTTTATLRVRSVWFLRRYVNESGAGCWTDDRLGSSPRQSCGYWSVLGMMNEVPAQFLEAQKQRGLAQTQLTPEGSSNSLPNAPPRAKRKTSSAEMPFVTNLPNKE